MPDIQKPQKDEIEVSILGGGNGYGECVAIHVGNGRWLVIDSALDPNTGRPLVLSYFDEIGVTSSSDVDLIVVSHWHDDHIKGMSSVVKECPNAQFVCSRAIDKKQFFILLELGNQIHPFASGVREFGLILDHLKTSGRRIKYGIQDRVIWRPHSHDNSNVEVISLSPSDRAIEFFDLQLKDLINNASPAQTIRDISPNHSSVVIAIRVGEEWICLGGDLENTTDQNMGWKAVLGAELVPKSSITLFKIPHHGSQNGYCAEFWRSAMVTNPWAGLTPYSRGRKKLPSHQDIVQIIDHTSNAFITAPVESEREKKRDPRAKKIIRDFGYRVREIPFSFGHICLRKPIGHRDSPWNVVLRGNAVRLLDLITGS